MLKVIALIIFAQQPSTGNVLVQPGGLFTDLKQCVDKAESLMADFEEAGMEAKSFHWGCISTGFEVPHVGG